MRIGIIGTDSSHADVYARLANRDKRVGSHRVNAILGDDADRSLDIARANDIPIVCESVEQIADVCDSALVLHRRGSQHARFAIALLDAGIPTYVDKPLAITEEDCAEILRAANQSRTLVTSYSSLRYAPSLGEIKHRVDAQADIRMAQLIGPADFASPFDGPYFYATHTAEICTALVGSSFASVSAERIGDTVHAVVNFTNGISSLLSLIANGVSRFHATLVTANEVCAGEIVAGDDAYAAAFTTFLQAVESGIPPVSEEEMLAPIRLVNGIERSLAAGGAPVQVRSGNH